MPQTTGPQTTWHAGKGSEQQVPCFESGFQTFQTWPFISEKTSPLNTVLGLMCHGLKMKIQKFIERLWPKGQV